MLKNSSSNDKTDLYLSKEAVLSMRIEDTLSDQSSCVYHHSKSSKKLSSCSLSSTSDDHLYIDNNCKCAPLHDRSRIKFYNRPRSQPNRCICTTERYYNCNYCTSNYPISVRRSKDGEETDQHLNRLRPVYGKDETNAGLQSPKIHLRPSPLPVSSHLIALLTLTSPSNKFIPPPNKNLASITQTKDSDTELLLFQ